MVDLIQVQRRETTGVIAEAYQACATALGSPRLNAALYEAINCVARADRVFFFMQPSYEAEPVLFTTSARETGFDRAIAAYRDQWYRSDPIRLAFRATSRHMPLTALRAAPKELGDTAYRRECYDRYGMGERLSIVRRSCRHWLIMNLARRASAGPFRNAEVTALATLGELLLPLATKHDLVPSAGDGSGPPEVHQLETRLAIRVPQLTFRERQVTSRSIFGMTAEAISIDLGIGISSVLTYRQRAYRRVGVCSAVQMSTLVLH